MGIMQMGNMDLVGLCQKDHSNLRRTLSGILKEPSDVEDVFQDAYIRMIDATAKGQQIENPPGFLHRVCVNLALDRVRLLQRQERVFVSDNNEDVESSLESLPCSRLNPEQECMYEDFNDSIAAVLEELPPKCGQVFVMSKYWDYNYQEIADSMGLSVSMIEKYLRRACRHLQESFAQTTH